MKAPTSIVLLRINIVIISRNFVDSSNTGSVNTMEKAVEAYRKRLAEKDDIIVREETIKMEIEQLTKELETLKATEVETRKEEMRKIAELKDSYLDCRRRAGSEESYVLRQEEVRETERRTDLDTEELSLGTRIKNLEMDIEHEERVTAEVESFLRDQHLEFSTKLAEWTQRYKEDTERKRQELESVIEKRADGLEKLKSQTQLCADTEKFVARVKAEKERLRLAQELERRREMSAVRIQVSSCQFLQLYIYLYLHLDLHLPVSVCAGVVARHHGAVHAGAVQEKQSIENQAHENSEG